MLWHCNFCITKTRHIFVQLFLGLILSIVLGLGFGFFVMLLWNGMLPDILGWKEITYWQGAGLVILTRLLFGSHGYYKETNQSQAGCHTHLSQPQTSGDVKNGDTYYEQWWEEEGATSLEKYTKKILDK